MNVVNLAAVPEFPSLMTSNFSFTSVKTAGAHWLADVGHVWNIACCIWKRQVETDAVSSVNYMAVSACTPCEIRVGWSCSAVWLKWRVYQRIKTVAHVQ